MWTALVLVASQRQVSIGRMACSSRRILSVMRHSSVSGAQRGDMAMGPLPLQQLLHDLRPYMGEGSVPSVGLHVPEPIERLMLLGRWSHLVCLARWLRKLQVAAATGNAFGDWPPSAWVRTVGEACV